MSERAERYWRQFLATLPPDTARPARYTGVFYFGIVPEDALPVLEPVLSGVKTATGSLLWSYEAEGKPVPRAGDHAIATDGYGNPMCIIDTVDVQVIPYDEVGEDYAWEGGERDRTLASWRAMYWDYIVGECQKLGREPSPKTPLVMERFRVAYREPLVEE
jgi:uncharacterized protein YhfF